MDTLTCYQPPRVQRIRDENYTQKTVVKFSIGFYPQAVSDGKAFSVRTILFNAIFSFVGTPCLNHREMYGRNAVSEIVAIECSLTFLTSKLDEEGLRQHLVEIQKSIPGTGFLNNAVDVVSERVNEPKMIYVCRNPLSVSQDWNALGKQVSSESFYETDASAIQPKNSESRSFQRDAFGQITKITFDYARPDVECCELSPVHIVRWPAFICAEQQDGITTYEVREVFLAGIVANEGYRRSLLNGSVMEVKVEFTESPNESGTYKATGNVRTSTNQKEVTPMDNSNPYNFLAAVIEQNASLREDCELGLITKVVLIKNNRNEMSMDVTSTPKYKLIVGVKKDADPTLLKTALSKLERFISVVSIKPTDEGAVEDWHNFCVLYCLQPDFELTTNLVREFQRVANEEKLRLFTLTRPLQTILTPAIKMVEQAGEKATYDVDVYFARCLANDEKLRRSFLNGKIVEARLVFQEVQGKADSFNFTGKLNLVAQGNQPSVLNAQNLYAHVAGTIEQNKELLEDILAGRLVRLAIDKNEKGEISVRCAVHEKQPVQVAELK